MSDFHSFERINCNVIFLFYFFLLSLPAPLCCCHHLPKSVWTCNQSPETTAAFISPSKIESHQQKIPTSDPSVSNKRNTIRNQDSSMERTPLINRTPSFYYYSTSSIQQHTQCSEW
uniref:Putative ovule protein n=1 Tax=Solanum chacoense TaxID=4108 RepID=A0A0V0IUK1_SOLCH